MESRIPLSVCVSVVFGSLVTSSYAAAAYTESVARGPGSYKP